MVYRPTENTRKVAQERRARIITTALEHIGDVGWRDFNCHTVAERMGIGVGTIYNYFPNAHELVEAAMGLLAISDVEGVRSTHHDPQVRLSRAVRTLVLRSNACKVASGAATHPHYRATITRVLEEAIAACVRARIIPRTNPSLLANALYGAVTNVLASDPSPTDETQDLLQTMVLRLVGVDECETVS